MQGPQEWSVAPQKTPPFSAFSLDPRKDSPCGGGEDSPRGGGRLPCQGRLLGGGCL